MKRSAPMKRAAPMKRSPMSPSKSWRAANKARVSKAKTLKQSQRAVTPDEQRLWDRMAQEIGCIACRVAGRATSDYVSIHHIEGRTKKGCHQLVLPLCAGCHQQGTGADKTLVAVHPYKARFEKLYGTQMELLAMIHTMLGTAL